MPTPGHGERPPAPERLPIPVVDNHTHLNIDRDGDPGAFQDHATVAAALAEAAGVGVPKVVQVGCELDSAAWTVAAVREHPTMLGGVAIHPNEAPRLAARGELDAALAQIEQWVREEERIRVVSETGLDYFRTGPEGVEAQQEAFRWHIDLAKRTGAVMQIHDRDAHEDVLRILAEEGAPERTVMHCFSGDMELARECVRRGYYLSFSGTVTFRSAGGLRNALAVTPSELLLVETDAPYLTPHPFRGAVNAPYLVPLTVRAMAATLNTSVAELGEHLARNSELLYGPW